MNNAIMNSTMLAAEYGDLGGAFSSERLAIAGEMTLLGMLMIFSVLASLWLILVLFSKLMTKNDAPKASVAAPAPAPVQAVEPAPVEESSDDQVIAAVIAAAVAAYMASEGNPEAAYNGGFRVVSFRRVQGGKAWNSKY